MTHLRRVTIVALSMVMGVSVGGRAAPDSPWSRGQTSASAMRKRIGVFLRCTGRDDPAAALAAVKSLGLNLIQISRLPERFYTPEGAREFDGLLKASGLTAVSVVVVFDGESYRDLDAIEATVGFRPAPLVESRLAYARKCIDFAKALGLKVVTFHVGVLPKDPADPIYQRMLGAVTNLSRYASERGVVIALETGQETAGALARFLDAVAATAPPVFVNFDIANLVLYGNDEPPAALRRLVGRVKAIHVKDGRLPVAPRVLGKETRLGEGRGDVKQCLAILLDAGFEGPLVIENYVTRETGVEPLEELRRAREYIEKALDELEQERARR